MKPAWSILFIKFQASPNYIVRPCFKQNKKSNKKPKWGMQNGSMLRVFAAKPDNLKISP